MVAIRDYSLTHLHRVRRRLRRELMARHSSGERLSELGPVLRCFLVVRHDLRALLRRSRDVYTVFFNLNIISTKGALLLFRFKPADLSRVANWLQLDETYFRRRHRVPSVERPCIVLRWLSSPARWRDLEELFGRTSSVLCEIFYETTELIMERCSHTLRQWRGDLMQERAALYAKAVLDKGGALQNCIGFIDGTGIFIARPGQVMQRSVYSGHKRKHMLKFQSVVTPDGLLFHLAGPMKGRRHDITLYRESRMDYILESGLIVGGEQYCLFGDKAYLLRPWMQVAFPADAVGVLNEEEKAFNT